MALCRELMDNKPPVRELYLLEDSSGDEAQDDVDASRYANRVELGGDWEEREKKKDVKKRKRGEGRGSGASSQQKNHRLVGIKKMKNGLKSGKMVLHYVGEFNPNEQMAMLSTEGTLVVARKTRLNSKRDEESDDEEVEEGGREVDELEEEEQLKVLKRKVSFSQKKFYLWLVRFPGMRIELSKEMNEAGEEKEGMTLAYDKGKLLVAKRGQDSKNQGSTEGTTMAESVSMKELHSLLAQEKNAEIRYVHKERKEGEIKERGRCLFACEKGTTVCIWIPEEV